MYFGESTPELFDRWTLNMFTFYQVARGDGWVPGIVRPMMIQVNGELKGKFKEFFPAILFISYYVIVSVVLFNIIVTTSHDLSNLIDKLYTVLDFDDNGDIVFHELLKDLYNTSLGGL